MTVLCNSVTIFSFLFTFHFYLIVQKIEICFLKRIRKQASTSETDHMTCSQMKAVNIKKAIGYVNLTNWPTRCISFSPSRSYKNPITDLPTRFLVIL